MSSDKKDPFTNIQSFIDELLSDMQRIPSSGSTTEMSEEGSMSVKFQIPEEWSTINDTGEARLVIIYRDANIKSIPYWRSIEDQFGEIIFAINRHSRDTGLIDVYARTYGTDAELQMQGLLAYANWELSQI